MNVLKPKAGDSIAIFGAGSVGLSALMAAKLMECGPIIVIDIQNERLELAKELGATTVINGINEDVEKEIEALGGVFFSVESTGNTDVLKQAIACLKKQGKCGVIGAPPLDATVEMDVNDILNNGKSIIGIVEGHSNPKEFIPRLIELQQKGLFPFEKFVSYYRFSEINQAFADMKSGKAIKPILQF